MPAPSPDRFPRSATYDLDWVRSLDMGPHPLWQLEDLLSSMALPAGCRVLDLGCGRGATSVFLARELGATVTACDLWVGEEEMGRTMRGAGVEGSVRVVNADARDLPFEDDEFDAVVSIDAFEYFGTDVHLLPSLLRVLRPGGHVGMTTPALRTDPYDQPPPAHVSQVVGWEAAAWHSPQWWTTHWERSGLVTDIHGSMQRDGFASWVAWCELVGEPPTDPVPTMLATDGGEQLGFAMVHATKL
ncbi:SAM-dependent methyltransferase [Serinicoccus kebangsaanensis]|uniref:SAM-dependent methyltransferase n=1 Tax=Serinicoccus kebangsaanensis TaxID=2602069 RepID=UPI00124EA1B9|nr:class I SAM-dependent methyltransferase [Serinicoccus kebangsaanensis]